MQPENTTDLALVERGIAGAVRVLRRKMPRIDVADLQAEGWRVALEALDRGTYKASRGTIDQYVFVTVRRQLAAYVGRQLAVVSVPAGHQEAGAPGQGALYQHRASEAVVGRLASNDSPEARLLSQERARRLAEVRERLRSAMGRHLSALHPRDQRIATSLWGLSGLPPVAIPLVARRLRVGIRVVYRVREKVRGRFLRCPRLRALRRELAEIREGNHDTHEEI